MASTQQLPTITLPDSDGGLSISISFVPASDAAPDAPPEPADAAAVEAPPTPASNAIPVHPIPSLQDAFTESLDEVTNGAAVDKPKLSLLDARARRERLLAQPKDAEPFDAAWRYRPGQSQHELHKLLAQISFGVYLLLNGMANSNAQVVAILQGHIDEVDEYLEVTLQDLAQAMADLNARLDHLKLPLSNIQVFEELLEDRAFRSGILEANERIDHILCRTNVAMRQWDDDIDAGLRCTAAFTAWLNDQDPAADCRARRPDVADVFDAMRGNADGWLLAFDDVHDRAQEVNGLLIRLMTVIAEMEKKAGEVSRRTWSKIPPFSSPAPGSRGGKSMSSHSAVSSRQSGPRLPGQPQPSIRSLSSSRASPVAAVDEDADAVVVDPPLPPLLPPRSSSRHAAGDSLDSRRSQALHSVRSTPSTEPGSTAASAQGEPGHVDAAGDESLYVLQPRIYSPRTPGSGSLPSPALKEAATILPNPEAKTQAGIGHSRGAAGAGGSSGSIRHRVSMRSMVPDAIQIPPRSVAVEASMLRPSSKYATPRSAASQPFDSAYCSDTDVYSLRQGSHAGSDLSLSPPVRPQVVHSPRSDQQQYYRPVQASPHSPLQQRPHTATGPHASSPQPGAHQLRKQPSQVGSMSTLSNVTLATYDEGGAAAPAAAPRPRGHEKPLKKKKSAFGWFKKAFSLDEEERAEFQARRAMAQRDRYYDGNSPKFLDGRRIR
ncbi:hypothetical protein CDD83_9803 [Cordyceps sp. RAO-2017]|nr:hypothetical protein CDD83_9803 [Cordyceps sp. RAO-2017]